MLKEGFGCGGEDDAVGKWCVPERGMAEMVAGEEERPRVGIVDCKREGPSEVLEHCFPVAVVEIQEQLLLWGRAGGDAAALRGFNKRSRVVDSSIEGEDHSLVVWAELLGRWLGRDGGLIEGGERAAIV